MNSAFSHFWRTLVASLLLFVACPARAEPLVVAPEVAKVEVWRGIRALAIDAAASAPNEVFEKLSRPDVVVIDSPNRILGRGTVPIWAAVTLRNPAGFGQLRMLTLEGTTQEDVRLFLRDGQGGWRLIPSLRERAHGRFGGGTEHPVWELPLEPLDTVDLLLRVEGPAIVRMPVFAYTAAYFSEADRNTHVLMGAALGVCLLVCLYVWMLRRYLDDVSVLFFLVMVIADLVSALWFAGVLSELFPAVAESLLRVVGCSAYLALFASGCFHARIYLETRSWAPGMDRWLRGLAWFHLGMLPWFPMVFPAMARAYLVWGGTAVAVSMVVISIVAMRKRVPLSGFIGLAWLAYLGFGMSFLLARAVPIPELWSQSVNALVQAMVVAMLFGLAMNQRMLRQRDQLVVARQEAMMQQAREAALRKERSLLFAAMAHDLRQPLVGAGLFAELLRNSSSVKERDELSEKLKMALDEVDSMLLGLKQLSDVNELSHSPKFETVRIDDVVAPIVEEYRGRSERKRVTIRYVPTRLSIETHVPYFQRIVRNVLSNALRYSRHGGRILVGCRRGSRIALVIADTGTGMTDEELQLAFEAFRRFDEDKSFTHGYGLGLFSVKSLAHALGIGIDMRSQKGRGTEFKLLFKQIEENGG